ncbi:glycosyltransferase family 2 protein [Segatella bryantii]|uniref:glycosyltransferase family 2 protein n=1 Tax=Segatella bryantii TaxID=77095 RepID=UPI00241FB0AB|nr:glycosyltransferase family 2 protein [Segatella bryantii]
MNKVNILLSSYNGERYIKEMIDSLLAQENVEIDLLVRDDGSTDNTPKILDEYQSKDQLTWYQGKNLKPAHSFMQLVKDSHDADYYAFADEDDYWKPEKVSTGVEAIKPYDDIPALYFSRTQLTDENLNPIPGPIINPKLTFGESLVYEFIPGCTMVFNKKLRDIINLYTPSYIPMHDVWIYSVALAVGAKIVFDPNSYILYRQHSSNTIGQGQGEMHEWKRRFHRFVYSEHSRYRRAQEIWNGYNQMMCNENKDILKKFIDAKQSIVKRCKLIQDSRLEPSEKSVWRLFKIATLLNIY